MLGGGLQQQVAARAQPGPRLGDQAQRHLDAGPAAAQRAHRLRPSELGHPRAGGCIHVREIGDDHVQRPGEPDQQVGHPRGQAFPAQQPPLVDAAHFQARGVAIRDRDGELGARRLQRDGDAAGAGAHVVHPPHGRIGADGRQRRLDHALGVRTRDQHASVHAEGVAVELLGAADVGHGHRVAAEIERPPEARHAARADRIAHTREQALLAHAQRVGQQQRSLQGRRIGGRTGQCGDARAERGRDRHLSTSRSAASRECVRSASITSCSSPSSTASSR